jgi:hypothetical protein
MAMPSIWLLLLPIILASRVGFSFFCQFLHRALHQRKTLHCTSIYNLVVIKIGVEKGLSYKAVNYALGPNAFRPGGNPAKIDGSKPRIRS